MILMYHKIAPETPTMWWVSVDDFYRQMYDLQAFDVVYLSEYDPANPNQAVITFDGVYENVYQYALPILKKFGYPFELFITSQYVGLNNEFDSVEPNAQFASKEQLVELTKNKGQLQWHSVTHPNLKEQTNEKIIIEELSIPKEVLDIDKKGFNWFAYPHGEYNEKVLKFVKERFDGAVSCNQGNNIDKYKFNRLTVTNDTSFRKNRIVCIIASYNYGNYLIEAVESVLKQTIIPDEILITDDCSTDDTELISRAYAKQYPDLIKYNRNENNMGIIDHFNKAISLTQSEFVFFLGADNRLMSNYIEETVCTLNTNKDIGVAYTDYALFGPNAESLYEKFDQKRKGDIIDSTFYKITFPEFTTQNFLLKELEKGNFIHGSSLYRRKAFEEVDGYQKSSNAEDHNLFVRMIRAGWKAAKNHNTFLEYRQHSQEQANHISVLQRKMLFYQSAYKKLLHKKSGFESSKLYHYSFKAYNFFRFLKHNRKRPSYIMKTLFKRTRNKLKT